MSTLLMTGILFAFAGCAALLMRKRLEEQLPLAVGLVVIVLYAFALFGRLQTGAYAVLGLAAAALAGQIYCLIRDRALKPWRFLITPGCMTFFLIALWLLVSFRGYMFSEWDDFSHWGLAVKNMSVYMALPSGVPEATITYTDYPPATTLFSWFWTHVSGAFNEEDAQRALNMMMLSFLLPAMKDQDWKHPGRALCMSTLLFMLPLAFSVNIYRTLQVDGLLGCMVLYMLFAWLLCQHDAGTLINVSCSLFLLTLVKEMGIAFALLALIVIAADGLVHSSRSRKGILKLAVLLMLPIAIGKLSWAWYLQVHQVGEVWNKSTITLESVGKLLLGQGHPDHIIIAGRFLESLCSPDLWETGHVLQLSCAMWLLLLEITQRWVLCRAGREAKRCTQAFRILQVGMVIYLFVLLLVYLFLFRADEAMNLNSLDRYLSSYMIPLAGLTVLMAIKMLDERCVKAGLHAPLCLMACMALVVNPVSIIHETVTAGSRNSVVYEQRMQEMLPERVMSRLDGAADRVYLVAAGDKGWQYYLGAYQLTPVRVQDGMWSAWPVANKRADWNDKTAIQYSPQEWSAVLTEGAFTYVYLDTVDERFISDYSALFEAPEAIRSSELYQVEPHGDGIKLAAVQ